MHKLKDDIHNCYECGIYPCSFQGEVSVDICRNCPVPCCHAVLVALVPCEEGKFESGSSSGVLKMNDDGWCYYFDKNNGNCTIYENRPIACRVASCRFIREGKIPDKIKIVKNRMRDILSSDGIHPLLK